MRTEILNEIKKLHTGIIKYSCGTLFKSDRRLELTFVTNVTPSDFLEEDIKKVVRNYVPSTVKEISINVKKIVTISDFVISSAYKWLQKEHRACSIDLQLSNFSIDEIKENTTLKISAEHTVCDFILSRGVTEELKKYLETQFVESFEIQLIDTGREEVDEKSLEIKLTENDLRKKIIRKITVDDVTRLFDDDKTKQASYIVDTKDYVGECYLCGVVSNIRELTTKTGKPYFIIEFSDRTASVSGTIFPLKAQIPKVQKLSVGSEIIVYGEYEMRNGYHNFRIRSINYCAFPKNFVPVARPKRPVPNEYSVIFPKKLVEEKQENFLVDESIPKCFEGRTFVVFDLETTGTEADDKITEIGAVKIVDGKIESYFETLVNPKKRITAQIEELTGISNEMVADAPIYEEVCADFYKYCDGATLVAHNIDFDSRFIRRQSQPLDYIFDHPLLDTLVLGRECITGVSNYKLNTLCDKFGISFNHHRAYSDAYACAKLLIEIMKIRKEFP